MKTDKVLKNGYKIWLTKSPQVNGSLDPFLDIKGYGLDRYNRILGVIYLNGNNINLEMVKQGLSKVYQRKTPKRLSSHSVSQR